MLEVNHDQVLVSMTVKSIAMDQSLKIRPTSIHIWLRHRFFMQAVLASTRPCIPLAFVWLYI